MKTGVRRLRNALAVAGAVMLFLGCGVFQRLVLWPAIVLAPSRRDAWLSGYMRWASARVFDLIGLAGARFDFDSSVPTREPTLVVMNHQSLLDIPAAILMCSPFFPLFVTRRSYGRFIPLVSPLLRIMRAPLIDPERSPKEGVAALGRAAQQLPRVRARGVAIGPFQPPADGKDITSFIKQLRERMVGELDRLREAA